MLMPARVRSASFTTSLASGVTDYKQENGRRYHAFREGQYYFPNDEVRARPSQAEVSMINGHHRKKWTDWTLPIRCLRYARWT